MSCDTFVEFLFFFVLFPAGTKLTEAKIILFAQKFDDLFAGKHQHCSSLEQFLRAVR